MSKKKKQGLVYSTDHGRTCPGCGHPLSQCCCSKTEQRPASDGIVRISRQTKGRKGSGVSLVSGIALADSELKKLARELKQKCGSGGTVKSGVIEIQGDHRDTLFAVLSDLGYRVKMAGG